MLGLCSCACRFFSGQKVSAEYATNTKSCVAYRADRLFAVRPFFMRVNSVVGKFI